MKNLGRFILFVVLISLLFKCKPAEVVTYQPNIEPKVFTAFKTFSFYQSNVTGSKGPNFAANFELAKKVIASQMTSRGFSEVAEGGDLLINIGVILEPKNQSAVSEEIQFMNEPNYTWENKPISHEKLKAGTITIEMVDALRKSGVWIGSVTKAAPPSEAAKQERISSAIILLFEHFPVKVRS